MNEKFANLSSVFTGTDFSLSVENLIISWEREVRTLIQNWWDSYSHG